MDLTEQTRLTEQERKRKLAESLLKGERVVVNSSGTVETPEEAAEKNEQVMSIPKGKLA